MMTSAKSRRPEKQKSGKDSEKEIQRDADKWQIVRLSLSRYGKMQAS
jgi:hypothetical protein